MSDQPQEKKIIVDEDWKSQVQAEKESVSQSSEDVPIDTGETGAGTEPTDVPLPPASLEILVGSLATQAMMSLGIIPNPITNKPERLLYQAKHLVDMLDMLKNKTEGNRTSEESELLEDTLHQLRMAYVAVSQSPPASPEG